MGIHNVKRFYLVLFSTIKVEESLGVFQQTALVFSVLYQFWSIEFVVFNGKPP